MSTSRGSTLTAAVGGTLPEPASVLPQSYKDGEKHLQSNGGTLKNKSYTLLVGEALRRGVQVRTARAGKWLIFSHRNRKFTFGPRFNTLNSKLARNVCTFKDIQSRTFLNSGSPGIENAVFKPGDEWRAWAWGQSLAPLVLKPLDGAQGKGVHVGIDSWGDFSKAFRRVASTHGAVLVEKFHTGTEHRFLVVDGKVVAVTERRPANVLGDGVSTVE